jgi:amphi-Trp domain-containing protein
MGEKRELKVERDMSLAELTEYLQELVNALRAGKLYVEHGSKVLSLLPAEKVKLEIEARQKKDKEKFGLEVTWTRPVSLGASDVDLRISGHKGESE